MPNEATILPLQSPVKQMLSPQEQKLSKLIAQIIVNSTIKLANEKGNTLPTV